MSARESTIHEYAASMRRAIDYMQSHLHEDLSVAHLSKVAGFSKFHFHRQFSAYTGMSVTRLVTRMRLKFAAHQLAFHPECRIIDIALEAGFSSPEAFSRSFKKYQGQTPSEFRRQPKWENSTFSYAFPIHRSNEDMNVDIVKFEETQLAVLEHLGDPATIMTSVSRFIEWRKTCDISPESTSNTYGIPYSDPAETPPAEFRFDLCGETRVAVLDNEYGIVAKTIPGGRCAVLRHVGSTDALGASVRQLYAEWLPGSGESTRDFPCFFHYVQRMPKVPEHEQVTDIYLPLQD